MNRRKLLASLPAVVAGGLLAAKGAVAGATPEPPMHVDPIKPSVRPWVPPILMGWDMFPHRTAFDVWREIEDYLMYFWELNGAPKYLEVYLQLRVSPDLFKLWGPRYSGHWHGDVGRDWDGNYYVETDLGTIGVFETRNDPTQPDVTLVVQP